MSGGAGSAKVGRGGGGPGGGLPCLKAMGDPGWRCWLATVAISKVVSQEMKATSQRDSMVVVGEHPFAKLMFEKFVMGSSAPIRMGKLKFPNIVEMSGGHA
jgi:hypothetical protein